MSRCWTSTGENHSPPPLHSSQGGGDFVNIKFVTYFHHIDRLITINIVAAIQGMHVLPAKHIYIAMRDYQESLTTGQTDERTDRHRTK